MDNRSPRKEPNPRDNPGRATEETKMNNHSPDTDGCFSFLLSGIALTIVVFVILIIAIGGIGYFMKML